MCPYIRVEVLRMPQLVGGANDFLPLCGGKLVAREHEANFIVENFGGGAGQGVEPVVPEHGKIIARAACR